LKPLEKNYKRIVIKVGGSLFVSPEAVSNIINQIADLVRQRLEIVVVSSGAIACGVNLLGIQSRPRELSSLQATAALGQNLLMDIYSRGLGKKGLNCGQVLLTREDFNQRKRYLNAKNTIMALIKLGAVPVINENDTVSTDEIKFGDNDRLSALVATLISADLLIILSDIDGLLDRNNKVVSLVEYIGPEIKALACPTDKKTCVGGMVTKLEAAKIAIDSRIPCVIANGRKENIISSIIKGPLASEGRWTIFLPKKGYLTARKRWIAFSTKVKGIVCVDKGAKEALVKKYKSLLSPGVVGVKGDFNVGDIVSVADERGNEFGRGKINYSSDELRRIKGQRVKKEVIHRDNLVII